MSEAGVTTMFRSLFAPGENPWVASLITNLRILYNHNTTAEQRKAVIRQLESIQNTYNDEGQTLDSLVVKQQIQQLIYLTNGINPLLGDTTQGFFDFLATDRQSVWQGLNGLIRTLQANEVAIVLGV